MPARNPPRLTLAKIPLEVTRGLPEDEQTVEAYFEHFEWDGASHDAATLSAEDFLSAFGP